jgi:hypothetical protein
MDWGYFALQNSDVGHANVAGFFFVDSIFPANLKFKPSRRTVRRRSSSLDVRGDADTWKQRRATHQGR